MAEILASDLANVINSIPVRDWKTQYNINTDYLDLMGGFQALEAGTWDIPILSAANSTAGAVAENATLTTAGSTTKTRVRFDQKVYSVQFGISGKQAAKIAGGGYTALERAVVQEMGFAMRDLLTAINTDLMASGSGNSLYGIQNLVDSGSEAFASVARSTNAWANSAIKNSNSGSTLLESAMFDVYEELTDTRGQSDSDYVIITTKEIRNQYQNLLRSSGSLTFNEARMGDLNVLAPTFEGLPVIGLSGMPAGKLYFVKRNNFAVNYLPATYDGEYNARPENIWKVVSLGKTGDVMKFSLLAYINQICDSPWTQGGLWGIKAR